MAYVRPPEFQAWMLIDLIKQNAPEIGEPPTAEDLLVIMQEGLENECLKCADGEGIGTGRFETVDEVGETVLVVCDVCQGMGKTVYPVVAESLGVRYYQQEAPPEEPPQAPLGEGGDPPEGI